MKSLLFKRGDFFCTINPKQILGKSITFVQKYRTVGIPSKANHNGFFLDENTIYESLWKVQKSNVWEYEGKDFLVGRWNGMTDEGFDKSWKVLKKYEGKFYPVPRLFMYLLFPVAVQLISPSKWLGLGLFSSMVCSELAARGVYHSGFQIFKEWRGMMPAHIANIIRRDRDIEIIYDSVLQRS